MEPVKESGFGYITAQGRASGSGAGRAVPAHVPG